MRKSLFALGVVCPVLLGPLPSVAPRLIASSTISIDHQAVACAVADQLPQFEAALAPANQVSRARIHFRPIAGEYWYSVDMQRQGDLFLGVLPPPQKDLEAFEYYISVLDDSFDETRSEEHTARVVDGVGACGNSRSATTVSTAAGKLLAPPGAPALPPGFGAIAGEAVAAGSAATAASAGGGIGTAAVVGGVAVAGGLAAVAVSGGSDSSDAGSGTGGGSGTTPDSAPSTTPTPAPTPEPTPTPAPESLDVSGSWTGTRDGTAGSCTIADDVFLSLEQQGGAVQGTLRLVFRSDATCGSAGGTRDLDVNGNLEGSTVTLAARRDSPQGIVSADLVGTAESGHMSGTFVAASAGGLTGSGVWSVER